MARPCETVQDSSLAPCEIERNSEEGANASDSVSNGSRRSRRRELGEAYTTKKPRTDLTELIDGCRHYRRRCRIVAPCCGEVTSCRHCHAEYETHDLDRRAIQEVVCSRCDTRQEVGPQCSSCDVTFASYYCEKCNFWDDEGLKKKIFHCDACGICRVGGRENYFHCPTCDCCYPMELQGNHRCVEGSLRQGCPVCMIDMFTSTTEIRILKCGHTIHQGCLAELQQTANGLSALRCPVCSHTIADCVDLWKEFDRAIEETPMPEAVSGRTVSIICCDCQVSSEVPFHVIGQKCKACNSYNTRRA